MRTVAAMDTDTPCDPEKKPDSLSEQHHLGTDEADPAMPSPEQIFTSLRWDQRLHQLARTGIWSDELAIALISGKYPIPERVQTITKFPGEEIATETDPSPEPYPEDSIEVEMRIAKWNKLLGPIYMPEYHRDRLVEAAQRFKRFKAVNGILGVGRRVKLDYFLDRNGKGLLYMYEAVNREVDIQQKKNNWSTDVPLRVKVILDLREEIPHPAKHGNIVVQCSPIPAVDVTALIPARLPPPGCQRKPGDPPSGKIWDIVIDREKTEINGLTRFKTTSRDMYDGARERAGIHNMTKEKEVLLVNEWGEIMEGSLTTCYFWRDDSWLTPHMTCGGQLGTTRRWALNNGLCKEGIINVCSLKEGEECWISNGVRGFQLGTIRLYGTNDLNFQMLTS